MAIGNYIKAWEYNGHVLTVQVQTNTSTVETDNGTESRHSVIGSVDGLSSLTVNATADGDSITDALLTDVEISYIAINPSGANTILYSGLDEDGNASFTKDVPGDVLTLVGSTFANGDAVDVYYLPDGDGVINSALQEQEVADAVIQMIANLQAEVDAVPNVTLYKALTALGLRYDA